jgi:hypothetical protein
MRYTQLAFLAMLPIAGNAAITLSFEPANPTPVDTIVLTIRDSTPTCPYITTEMTRFAPPNEIWVVYGHLSDCGFGRYSEAKTTIGRFPAGNYKVVAVTYAPDITPAPGFETSKDLVVAFPGGPSLAISTAPLEDSSGYYLTGHFGEGVSIEQLGEKAFVTLETYDGEGRPTWLVMPDTRWRYNSARPRAEFVGPVYRTRRGEESPPSVTVSPVGTAVWYVAGFDVVMLEITVDGTTNTRTLRRFRF